ncbi:MAG: serine/threonine protein kinase [Deltaproteobacteria bacterium]|nr:serine/threonine protein kinase [Deltaproteobacteria bacterium]
MAHSNTKLINQPFRPLKKGKQITAVGKLAIQEGILPTNQKAINFSYNVTYAKVLIGKVLLAFSPSQLDKSSKRYQNFFIASVFLSCLLSFMGVATGRNYKILRKQAGWEGSTEMGSYKLRDKIAVGGMAEVYTADYIREDGFRKRVAIKRILPHIANNVEFIKMFTQEARLAALLQHPNIVQIYDFGKLNNDYYIAMEYIHGRNLAQMMSAQKSEMDIEKTVFIISGVCRGLQYSHLKRDEHTGEMLNIVHRDISPQNILISFEGEVKITDFGICKAACEPSLTKAGTIKGKVCYLSPEQALGKTVDNQTDIYALGIIFYEMISGKRLYQFRSEIEAIRSIPEKEIAPLKILRPEITDELNTIVMKCLEKNKSVRYHSAQELQNDLIRMKQRLGITYDTSDLAYFMKRYFKEEQKVVDG